MDTRPIGVFDSGLGGLTALRELARLMPEEDLVYFGDTGRVPYGGRSPEVIVKYARQDVAFLRTFDPKAIVIACGTVSATALEALREENTSLKANQSAVFATLLEAQRYAERLREELTAALQWSESLESELKLARKEQDIRAHNRILELERTKTLNQRILELEDERINPKHAQVAVKAYLQRAGFAGDTKIEIGGMEIGIYE